MEQRRLVIAALLSLAVLIVWQIIFPPPPPEELPEVPAVESTVPSAVAPARAEQAADRLDRPPAGGADRAETAVAPAGGPAEPVSVLEPIGAESEETVLVESSRFRARFTNRGAQLVSFELEEHEADDLDRVDLVRRRPAGPWPFALEEEDGTLSTLNDVLFRVERERTSGGEIVRFRYRGPAGEAEKEFRFAGGGLFDVTILRPGAVRGWSVLVGPGVRNPSAAELANRFARRSGIYFQGDKVERIEAAGADETTVVPALDLRWAGLQDTYFLTVLVARGGAEGVVFEPMIQGDVGIDGGPAGFLPLSAAPESKGARELAMWLRSSGETLDVSAYFGAKVYADLASFGLGLEQSVERGRYLGVIVGPLQWGLRWIHDHLVANYGWAIIFMTVLIKVLLFPLTFKSMVSMQRMQEVNPKIQAIRKRYQGKLKDKQGKPNAEAQRKMNEEVMALYKAEGVNPAGGCLPMILQLPILFAFYRLLYTAVELRHAPWIGWIHDLSTYDPYFVLPIVMGGTQFLQQKVTPQSGDPMQRRIFLMMPVIFTVLFLKFPSGLVLYWLTNNVLTIVQQLIYMRVKERRAAAA